MRFVYGLFGMLLGAFLVVAVGALVAALVADGGSFAMLLAVPAGALVMALIGIALSKSVVWREFGNAAGETGLAEALVRRRGLWIAGPPHAAVALMTYSCGYNATPPSDAALLDNFARHRTQVETLVSMVHQDT